MLQAFPPISILQHAAPHLKSYRWQSYPLLGTFLSLEFESFSFHAEYFQKFPLVEKGFNKPIREPVLDKLLWLVREHWSCWKLV